MDLTEAGKVQALNQFGFGLDQSVLLQVLRTNGGDVDKATDELLTLAARLDRTQITDPKAAIAVSDEEAQNMRAFAIESKNVAENKPKIDPRSSNGNAQPPISDSNSSGANVQVPIAAFVAPPALIQRDEPESIYRSAASSLSGIVDLPPISDEAPQDIEELSAKSTTSNDLRHQSAAVVAPLEPLSLDDDLTINGPEQNIQMVADKRDDDLVPGRFFIYKRQDLTKKAIDEIISIRSLLKTAGITDVAEVDLTHDHELAGFIKAKCGGKLIFPVVFLKTHVIGSFDELKEAQQSGKLQQLIDDDKTSSSNAAAMDCAPELQLNVLDKCLNAAETVLSWLNPVSWLWRSKPQEAPKDVVDFDVVQSNWYWRHQRRKLRFAQDFFLRIHPTHLDIRAAHKIDAIASISVSDHYNFVIRYKDGSSPDFIRCKREDLPKILDIVQTRSKAIGAETPIQFAPGLTIDKSN